MNQKKRHVVFRADGGPNTIGLGHIMRCLALASEFKKLSYEVCFVTKDYDQAVLDLISSKGFYIEILDTNADQNEDLDFLLEVIGEFKYPLVVVDSYEIGTEYLKALKDHCVLLSIDDNADIALPSHIILNANVYAEPEMYNQDAFLILGSEFAFIREDFLKANRETKHKEIASNVLITFGGSDPTNQSMKTLSMLSEIDMPLDVKAVVGSSYNRIEEIKSLASSLPYRAEIIVQSKDMPGLMEWADIAVTAGGGTCYECAFMGLPNIIIVTEDNQVRVAKTLDFLSSAISMGWHEHLDFEKFSNIFKKLSKDVKIRSEISEVGRGLIDGNGARRSANLIHKYLSSCQIQANPK
ncbi:MAG: UDP-2,4-diacetamido-2,4,6-trideoxy-beta-L-altropyranose hydrolase [Patescibacteria group bacterium]|nr:UDP-2,4-diacetamido-2,4,6-trideoxy-beta-L-altropyranose hydrolase [Patescibacteria group bacterium]